MNIASIYLAVGLSAAVFLTGCQTVTRGEAQKQFADEIRTRGSNPYIQHELVRDLERRMQNIVLAPIQNNTGEEFDPRTREILANFEDRFSYSELMRKIRLTRQGWARLKQEYPLTSRQTGCRISPSKVRLPVWDVQEKKYYEPFSFEFMEGDCDENKQANGIGWAYGAGGDARFYGEFQRGRMVEGVFIVNAKNGDLVLGIGDIPTKGLTSRLLVSRKQLNGLTQHRYSDYDDTGRAQGFNLTVTNYKNYMVVRSVGDFKDDKRHGFAARMYKQKRGESSNWSVLLGMWENGKMHGLGGYTNGIDWIQVSEWKNGTENGIEYGQYADADDDTHHFEVGRRVNGKREGVWQVTASNSFATEYWTETYRNGEEIANSIQPAFDLGQVIAFSMGAGIIAAADVPSAAKLQIGTALMQDTLGGGGGSNLAALQQSFSAHANQTTGGTTGSSTPSTSATASAGNGLKTEQVTITCPSGVSNVVPITYRTNACFTAAERFAKTYACNKLDHSARMKSCIDACGHPQCLQK